jgi:hypothetical protein
MNKLSVRVVLIENAINEYLNDKAGIVKLSLERLCDAIDREEAEKLFTRGFAGWHSRAAWRDLSFNNNAGLSRVGGAFKGI